jgi:hypothetical protein
MAVATLFGMNLFHGFEHIYGAFWVALAIGIAVGGGTIHWVTRR